MKMGKTMGLKRKGFYLKCRVHGEATLRKMEISIQETGLWKNKKKRRNKKKKNTGKMVLSLTRLRPSPSQFK